MYSEILISNGAFGVVDVAFFISHLYLSNRPLEIIYDASTINQVAEFFKPPESVHLSQLQAAAASKFEELKEMSATGIFPLFIWQKNKERRKMYCFKKKMLTLDRVCVFEQNVRCLTMV